MELGKFNGKLDIIGKHHKPSRKHQMISKLQLAVLLMIRGKKDVCDGEPDPT